VLQFLAFREVFRDGVADRGAVHAVAKGNEAATIMPS
jgi:hypothetical protein